MAYIPTQGLDKKGLAKKYRAALDKLLIAEQELPPGGKSDAADAAYRNAIVAREAAIKAGLKVEEIPVSSTARLTGDGTTDRPTLNSQEQIKAEIDRASISDNNGTKLIQAKYPNTKDEQGNPRVEESYLYVEPANAKMRGTRPGSTAGQMGIQWGTNDTVRNLYQKQLMNLYGSKEALYNKLYQAGYIKNKKMSPTTGTREVLDALQMAVADYSLAQTNDYKDGKIKGDFPTMDAFLSTGKRDAGASVTQKTKTATVYDESHAKTLARDMYQKLMGRDPSEDEFARIVPDIQAWQKKHPETRVSTQNAEGTIGTNNVTTGGDAEEYLLEKLSQKNEVKANKVLSYYDVFKQVIGVN